MSARDQEMAAAILRAAAACDGAVLGLGVAFVAASSWTKYLAASAALHRIRAAPSVAISELRSLFHSSDSGESEGDGGRLVAVRGRVQPQHDPLESRLSGKEAVIVQYTQTCLYNEWRGLFGWSFDLHALFAKSWKERYTRSFGSVPFVLEEYGCWRNAVIPIKLDRSKHSYHPLPLTTVYHQLYPVRATALSFFQAFSGNGFPVALLDEEKILPVGKEITAIGLCQSRDGSLELSSCQDLPYFLSEMTKSEMEAELVTNTTTLFWGSIVLGAVSVSILGYAVYRNWGKFKAWREMQARRRELQNMAPEQYETEEVSGDVSDGELCVICLVRRRGSAFVPCGHLVCCPQCALRVERESSQLCPVCRQGIRSALRIYDS